MFTWMNVCQKRLDNEYDLKLPVIEVVLNLIRRVNKGEKVEIG